MKTQYCAHQQGWDTTYFGTYDEIVNQIFKISFDGGSGDALMVTFKTPYFKDHVLTFHSYSPQWTREEREIDAEKFLFQKLSKDFGFCIYKYCSLGS